MKRTVEQTLQEGIAAHKEGKFQEAARLYRTILQSQPLHPDANHNLGVLAVSVNKADVALPLFKTALEANPKIEQPFKYCPYVNLNPGLGLLSGKRVFAVGDSLFCGHPKMGNGLGRHLPFIKDLVEKMARQ